MVRVAVLTIVLLSVAACANRVMVIKSDPPGATVYVNREKVETMTTPALVPFDHHGTFAIRLKRDGYETLDTTADVETPWYSYPVISFFSDLIFPWAVNERHEFEYQLEPIPVPEVGESEEEMERRRAEAIAFHEQVKTRAEDLRQKVNEGDPAEVE